MQTTLRIAFRNTTRQKKRSLMLGGAIAFGIMVITLLNAFTAGMVDNLKANFTNVFGGHIYVSGTELTPNGRLVNTIGNDVVAQAAMEQIKPYIKQVNKRSQTFGEMVFGSKSAVQTIDGIDWQAEKDLTKSMIVLTGSLNELSDPQALVLPKSSAEKIGVAAGETLLLKLSTVTGQQNVGEFRLIAVIEDQTNFGVSTGYAHLSYLNELLGIEPSAYQALHIYLNEMKDMNSAAEALYNYFEAHAVVEPRLKLKLPMGGGKSDNSADEEAEEEQHRQMFARIFGGQADDNVTPWNGTKFGVTTLNDIMEPVMSMVSVLDTVGLVVFLILLVITMVGIMNTFRMILIERTQEIGTMRAFGMQRNMVRNIFVLEASIIGLGGALAGLLASGLAMLALRAWQFTNTSPLQFVLSNGRFSFHVVPTDVAVNIILLMMLTLFAAYMPARAAARLRPADALRAQY